MPYGHNIYSKASDMLKATMFAYTKSDHALPHWKYVLQCCVVFPCVNLTDQETYNQYYNTSPSIKFHIYNLISRCTTYGRLMLNDRKICRMCKHDSASENPQKYTLEKS